MTLLNVPILLLPLMKLTVRKQHAVTTGRVKHLGIFRSQPHRWSRGRRAHDDFQSMAMIGIESAVEKREVVAPSSGSKIAQANSAIPITSKRIAFMRCIILPPGYNKDKALAAGFV